MCLVVARAAHPVRLAGKGGLRVCTVQHRQRPGHATACVCAYIGPLSMLLMETSSWNCCLTTFFLPLPRCFHFAGSMHADPTAPQRTTHPKRDGAPGHGCAPLGNVRNVCPNRGGNTRINPNKPPNNAAGSPETNAVTPPSSPPLLPPPPPPPLPATPQITMAACVWYGIMATSMDRPTPRD